MNLKELVLVNSGSKLFIFLLGLGSDARRVLAQLRFFHPFHSLQHGASLLGVQRQTSRRTKD